MSAVGYEAVPKFATRRRAWEDEVRNEGHYTAPHMFLYHMNFGAPLLDAACELVAPIREVRFAMGHRRSAQRSAA